MPRFGPTLKRTLSLVFLVCVGYFLWRALRRNWASVSAFELHPSYPFVAAAFGVTILSVLFSTWSWHLSVNSLAEGESRITFKQSFATVNLSGLTKYVPGKVWAYALQMYLLTSLRFSKSLVLYVNLLNLAISLICNVMLGLACWLIASSQYRAPVGLALAGLVLFDIACILFCGPILSAAVTLLNRAFKRNISRCRPSPALMLELHALHFGAAMASGLSSFLLCFAVGYHVDVRLGFLVTASSLIADVAGYLAFMVPGGLGVREGIMFALLGGAARGPIALVLPLAARIVSMLSDISVGALAVKLVRGWSRSRPE